MLSGRYCYLHLKDGNAPRFADVFSVTERVCDSSRGWHSSVSHAKAFVFPPTRSKYLLQER